MTAPNMTTYNKIKVYNRIPESYNTRGYPNGSNQELFLDTIIELGENREEIEEVHLALYLFNNRNLFQSLSECAWSGARVTVTSLPLSGYDSRKIAEAKKLYAKIVEDDEISLKIFPHMYSWYGARYAGGGASYSFHIKTGLIEYKNGSQKVFVSSGNYAPGDPTHSETAIFIESVDNSHILKPFSKFFNEVEKRAIDFKEYHDHTSHLEPVYQRLVDFSFIGGSKHVNFSDGLPSNFVFSAPFIKMNGLGSNHYAREKIIELISNARHRLLLCAQHSHDIKPFDGYKGPTIIGTLIEKKRANPDIDVRVLKQVSSSGLADKRRAAFVEGHLHYSSIPQKVNRLVHDKFIVADDVVLITSANFTATQFGWGDRRMEFRTPTGDIKKVEKIIELGNNLFDNDSNQIWTSMSRPRSGSPIVRVLKNDIFSEVNAFIIIEDQSIASSLAYYYERLWNHNISSNVEIPI